jgi:[acyl-carrier-protein] S-malonyltransferase
MSSKQIAMIFPGQGSQFVGMGKELACQYPEAAKVFAEADELLDYSISQLCFEGPEDKLRETRYTQPAIYVTSAAAYAVLRKEGIKPGIVAGHSLGAFSALYVSGAFDFATGLRLVQIRGKAMQKAAEIRAGTMAAINGLDAESVLNICDTASEQGIVVPANWNSTQQIVISGEQKAVEAAVELARRAGARRPSILSVHGAFHSPLVQPAVEVLRDALAVAEISKPYIPFISNTNADYLEDPDEIRDRLAHQVVSCVLWCDSIQKMASAGCEYFIEVGPGKILTGLLKRIDNRLKGLPFGTPNQLESIRDMIPVEPAVV